MNQKIDLEEIKQKLFTILEPSGWGQVLKPFIFSGDFDNILTQLVKLSNEGKRFTPTLKQLFKAFIECPYNELKVVVLGQDPYKELEVADGLAFSCGNTKKAQPSLNFILEEINRTVYNGHPGSLDPDLTRWANQGILLLNTALTTEVGKVGQHYEIWKPFLAYLLDHLNCKQTGLVYIYMGKQAQEWSDSTSENNFKFMISHPASAAYKKLSRWDSDNVFVKTREIIDKQFNYSIHW
jgi:uracil-DNA glycosylase